MSKILAQSTTGEASRLKPRLRSGLPLDMERRGQGLGESFVLVFLKYFVSSHACARICVCICTCTCSHQKSSDPESGKRKSEI